MYVHTYIRIYTHTYIHSFIHSFIHTYIHTYIQQRTRVNCTVWVPSIGKETVKYRQKRTTTEAKVLCLSPMEQMSKEEEQPPKECDKEEEQEQASMFCILKKKNTFCMFCMFCILFFFVRKQHVCAWLIRHCVHAAAVWHCAHVLARTPRTHA